MSMNMNQQSKQDDSKSLEMILLLVSIIIAWPALLLGVVLRWQIKQRVIEPFPYWMGAGVLGTLGTYWLASHANPYPLFLMMIHDIIPLVSHFGRSTLLRVMFDALPLWERSLLVCPWIVLVLELFSPKNLQAHLLAQERERRAIQTRKSKRAARRVVKAPTLINGKGVFGAVIDNPNE